MSIRKKNLWFVLAVSVVMSILRTFIVSTNLEKNSANADIYYLPENFIVVAFASAFAILVLAFLTSSIRFGRKTVVFDDHETASSVGSLIAAFLVLGTTVAYFIVLSISQAKAPSGYGPPTKGGITGLQDVSVLEILVIAFAIASALKFLLIGIRNHKSDGLSSSSLAILSLFPIVFASLRLLNDFVKTSAIPMASSNAYHMISLVALLLFFLVEGKSYVSESKSVLVDFYGYVAIFSLLVYAIPDLVIHLFGTFDFDMAACFSIADLGFATYVITRLYSTKE